MLRATISREKLLRLRIDGTSTHKEELDEFYKLYEAVEKERDHFKNEATIYAAEVDQKEEELKQLTWQCNTLKSKLDEKHQADASFDMADVLPSLPRTLLEVVQSAQKSCSRLIITESALKAAEDYEECKSLNEAWQMLLHLNNVMHRMKFESSDTQDWEKAFADQTGYDLAMSEGKQTKGDKKLMRLRQIEHDGKQYDITPHVKYGNQEPKLVRIYFDFDEAEKKIVVGHIGKHIPNATSKSL